MIYIVCNHTEQSQNRAAEVAHTLQGLEVKYKIAPKEAEGDREGAVDAEQYIAIFGDEGDRLYPAESILLGMAAGASKNITLLLYDDVELEHLHPMLQRCGHLIRPDFSKTDPLYKLCDLIDHPAVRDPETTPEEPLLLCRLFLDTYRHGSIEEFFLTTQSELDKVWGKSMYFSEELGKHSEFDAYVDEKLVTTLTDDQMFISQAIEYGLVNEKHRPWYRISGWEEGEFE